MIIITAQEVGLPIQLQQVTEMLGQQLQQDLPTEPALIMLGLHIIQEAIQEYQMELLIEVQHLQASTIEAQPIQTEVLTLPTTEVIQ